MNYWCKNALKEIVYYQIYSKMFSQKNYTF